ncbi:acyltransferase family protein [Hymenobacter metallicola]|uniref:Acyltransferase n=1 Tax=Hymenobacter metallicola TaxID=2563114 RepID=A0A4Z0QET0_9BACT|nr:acyltransferase [Hymenobacter metallicola]TGE27551.1 acyltransferase [Hymenobacter metallicola]
METKKYDYIDALRGVAVLAVLLVHCALFGTNTPNHPLFAAVVQQGARGVQLFYVLSALTLYLSMGSRARQEQHPTLNFFLRRFFRIAPLFYCAILYYLWQDGWGPRAWLGDAPAVTLPQVLSTMSFSNGWNPRWINSIVPGGWSIAVEMSFYLILPLVFLWVNSLQRAVWLVALTTLGAVAFVLWFGRHPLIPEASLWADFLFLAFPTQLPIFAMGIVLFFLLRTPQADPLSSAPSRAWLLLLTVGLLVARLLFGDLVPNYLCFGVVFVLLTYALSLYPIRLLVNPLTIYAGKISYSMYLTHFAVLHLMTHLHLTDFIMQPGLSPGLLNYALRYLTLLGLDLLVATTTYHLIEKPGMALGKRLIASLEKPQPTSLVTAAG